MSFFVIEMDKAKAEIDRIRAELAAKDGVIANLSERSAQYEREAETLRKHGALWQEKAEELRNGALELHRCLAAMVDRWEPDTEGLDRVMWENACEALGREIWDRSKTT